jgi:glycosyltransferase involved in cell wall biosynthesis
MKFSVVLATHNEEEHIEKCLTAVLDIADEVIVVDGESIDKTVALAEKMGAQVIETTNKAMFHTNKQMAMDAASGDWVLQLDADEVVDDDLKLFIRKTIATDSEYAAYWLKRKNYFLGMFLKKGGQYPDPVIRLYKKGKAYLPQKDVHEQMEVDGKVGWAEGHLLHYNAPNFSRYITNANRYTTQTAKKLKEQGIELGLWNDLIYLIWKPKVTFLKLFFRHKGFVDGFPGFVFALFSGLHHAIAYMKLGDLYREERRIKNKE